MIIAIPFRGRSPNKSCRQIASQKPSSKPARRFLRLLQKIAAKNKKGPLFASGPNLFDS
jgi:hypothetical protein